MQEWPPCGTHMVCIKLESFVRSQNDESFCLQYRHSPHAIWNETTTRCDRSLVVCVTVAKE